MNAPIIYTPGAVPNPDLFFAGLQKLDWEHRDAPRQEFYCNDFAEPYVYGKGLGQRTYYPKPYTAEILALRSIAQDAAEAPLEVCFLTRYMNQKDQLGWHADDSPEMDDARPIVIVSLGVEREIWFRPKPGAPREAILAAPEKLKLQHGSVCVMMPGMQDTWQHRIPKASFEWGERISLTFRGYVKP